MQEGQGESAKRRSRLRDIISTALDQAYLAADIPNSVVDGIVDAVGGIPHPGVNQVAEIVGRTLEITGEGAKEAAEHAGEIAESIVDAIGDIDLSI